MSQARGILKNTAFLSASRLMDRVSGVVLAVIASRFLGAAGFGVYSAALAYYGTITTACELGANSLLTREIAKDRDRTSHYLCHMAVFGFIASALLTAVSFLIVPYFGHSPELTASTYVVILAIFPGMLKGMQEAVFVAHQRVEFITLTTLLAAVATMALSLLLLLGGYGIVSLVITFVIVQCLVAACYFLFIHGFLVRLRWMFAWTTARDMVGELKPFAASSLLGGLCARPEVVILSFVSTEAQIGFYSAALKLVNIMYMIPRTMMINVFPALSRSYQQAGKTFQQIQDKSIKYLLALSLPVAAGLAVTAGPVIELVYGPGFEPAAAVLRILAFAFPLTCLHAVLWRVLSARGEQGRVVQTQLVSTVTRIGSGGALTAWLAALGAAIAMPVNMLLHVALLARQVRRGGAPLNVIRLGWRFAAAAAVMGALTLALSGWFHLFVLIPIGVGVYAACVMLFKAFSDDDLALLRRLRRPSAPAQSGDGRRHKCV